MSVQSQIERITDARDAQTALIQQIKEELQGKATGGGSEDLDAVLTERETLISQLQEALQSKAAHKYLTCTIKITDSPEFLSDTVIYEYLYTAVKNGKPQIVYVYSEQEVGDGLIFEDVLCGSVMYLLWDNWGVAAPAVSVSKNMDIAENYAFLTPLEGGAIGAIEFNEG